MANLTLKELQIYNASATERFILEEYGIDSFVEVIHRSHKKKADRHKQMIKIFKIQFMCTRSLIKFLQSIIGQMDFSVTGHEVKIKLNK